MKYLFLIFSISLSLHSQSQELKLSFDHSAIEVNNLELAGEFYKEILNLAELETPNNNPDLRWFDLGNGKQLHLIKSYSILEIPGKGVHLSLRCENINLMVEHMQALQIPFEDWNGQKGKVSLRPDGVKQIYIQDYSGYWIEINNAR